MACARSTHTHTHTYTRARGRTRIHTQPPPAPPEHRHEFAVCGLCSSLMFVLYWSRFMKIHSTGKPRSQETWKLLINCPLAENYFKLYQQKNILTHKNAWSILNNGPVLVVERQFINNQLFSLHAASDYLNKRNSTKLYCIY